MFLSHLWSAAYNHSISSLKQTQGNSIWHSVFWLFIVNVISSVSSSLYWLFKNMKVDFLFHNFTKFIILIDVRWWWC